MAQPAAKVVTEADKRYEDFMMLAMYSKSRFFYPPDYKVPEFGEIEIRGCGMGRVHDRFNRPTLCHHCIYIVEFQGDQREEVPRFIYPGGIDTSLKKGQEAMS